MTSKIDSFPANGTHVNLSLFPAPFLLDVDNDGVKDLLVTPQNIGQAENSKSVWFYKNTGTSSSPSYVLQSKNFLQQEMIDVGRGAAPAFFDFDGDVLVDLLIGNYAYVTQTT